MENLMDKLDLKLPEQRNALAVGTSQLFEQIITPDKASMLLKLNKLNDIVTRWENILQRQSTTTQSNIGTQNPYLEGVKIIGRQFETNEIVEMLLSCETKIGISIIGMCGLGKSSLAQTIMDDRRIKENFYPKWLHIKDGKLVWNNIEKEIKLCFREFQEAEVVVQNENGHKARKLLIVFDNLLDMLDIEWDRLSGYTQIQGCNSYKIIITTRNPRISDITDTSPYYLKVLSDILCEDVIKENAKDTEPLEPSFISTMAEKCEGLPWIAQRLGNILGRRNAEQRKAFGEATRLWYTEEFKTEFFPQLMLSYKDLNQELRCFAYFSLFPINHRFNSDDLVRLWVAESFAQSKETGEKYVDDLKRRLILQSSDQEYKLQSFGLDFAVFAALGTCLRLDQMSSLPTWNENIRHLSLSCHIHKDSWSQLKVLHLRTFLSLYTEHNPGRFENIPTVMKESLKHLRVLSLTRTYVIELPDLARLKYLRYLDVSFTPIKVLPKTLHKFIALQTLKVKGSHFSHWRSNFYRLTNLRYVDWEQSDIRTKGIPRHIGKLSLLESLPLFMVGTEAGYSIKELKELDKLNGSLWIENLQLVVDEAEARGAMLHHKHELRKIVLQWAIQSKKKGNRGLSKEEERKESARNKSILTGLEPSENLRELIIINYKGDDLPEWISDSKIEKVQLKGCSYRRVPGFVPALGKMKELKTLVLEDMESIDLLSCRSDIDADTGLCFPTLESLEVHNMPQLRSWTGVNACDMPRLRQMKSVNCPEIDELFLGQFKSERPSVKIYVGDDLILNENK